MDQRQQIAKAHREGYRFAAVDGDDLVFANALAELAAECPGAATYSIAADGQLLAVNPAPVSPPAGFAGWTVLEATDGVDHGSNRKATVFHLQAPDGRVGWAIPTHGAYKFHEQLELFGAVPRLATAPQASSLPSSQSRRSVQGTMFSEVGLPLFRNPTGSAEELHADEPEENPPAKAETIVKRVTAQIAEALQRGTAPWLQPWSKSKSSGPVGALPYNGKSGRTYSGGNVMILLGTQFAYGYPTGEWFTRKQVNDAGGKVRVGQDPAGILFFKVLEVDADPADESDDGKRLILRGFGVFNRAQCDGLPDSKWQVVEPSPPPDAKGRIKRADAVVKESGATIHHHGNEAFYARTPDTITMPAFASFHTPSLYYSTIFHELGHWTGAPHRLDRVKGKKHGDDVYAFEELIAELCSAFTCAALRIDKTKLQHASYVASWISRFKEDPQTLFRAAAQAQRAFVWLMPQVEDKPEKVENPSLWTRLPAPEDQERWAILDENRNSIAEVIRYPRKFKATIKQYGPVAMKAWVRLPRADGGGSFIAQTSDMDAHDPVKSVDDAKVWAHTTLLSAIPHWPAHQNPSILTGAVHDGMVTTYDRTAHGRKRIDLPVPAVPDWRRDFAHPPRRLSHVIKPGCHTSPLVQGCEEHAPVSVAYTGTGKGVDCAWQVVDLADLRVSHDPWTLEPNADYDQELQPRDRSRTSYADQIRRLVQTFQPELLMWSATVADGAPVVSDKGMVLSGNGRTMALARVYRGDGEKAQAYRQTAKAWADFLGAPWHNYPQPVLVRVLQGKVDLAQFARDANVAGQQAMAAAEQALSDAAALPLELCLQLDPAHGIATRANAEFVRQFVVAVAGPAALGSFQTKDGTLSSSGQFRIELALFAKAWGPGSEALLIAWGEDPKSDLRVVIQAMADSAPAWLQLAAAVEDGVYEPKYLIGGTVVEAALLFRAAKAKGIPAIHWIRQLDMVQQPSALAEEWIRAAYPHGDRASAKALTAALTAYPELVEAQGPIAQGGMFGPTDSPPLELVKRARQLGAVQNPAKLSELEKLLNERDKLRAQEMQLYAAGASRAKRTGLTFKINDINERIASLRGGGAR